MGGYPSILYLWPSISSFTGGYRCMLGIEWLQADQNRQSSLLPKYVIEIVLNRSVCEIMFVVDIHAVLYQYQPRGCQSYQPLFAPQPSLLLFRRYVLLMLVFPAFSVQSMAQRQTVRIPAWWRASQIHTSQAGHPCSPNAPIHNSARYS